MSADRPLLFRSLGMQPALAPTPAAEPPARLDVAVVGAGVIGLSVAWRLAERGLAVGVFDAGQAGRGTSSAATGMLAAAAEYEPGGDDLLRLGLESQGLWPGFRDALEAASGIAIDFRTDGTLVVAIGRDETERLRARHEFGRRAGLDTRWLPGSEVRSLEPGLKPAITGGFLCCRDGQVDPPLVLAALRRALLAAGGLLFEGTAVDGLERIAGRVAGVIAGGRAVRADAVILAAGAAAGSLPWLPPEVRLPVRPLKGQSIVLRPRGGGLRRDGAPANADPLSHVLWTSEVHLAPKSDGRLVLGATMEEAGFDASITAGGVLALLDAVRRVLPGVEEMAIEDIWAGFRPTTDDDGPILGELLPGLAAAAGHHRNGYLLAPVTAQALADLVVDGSVRGAARHFGPERVRALDKGAA